MAYPIPISSRNRGDAGRSAPGRPPGSPANAGRDRRRRVRLHPPTPNRKHGARDMPTAAQPNTTPTRGSALGFTATAIVVGFTTPVLTGAPAANADAELIAACEEAITPGSRPSSASLPSGRGHLPALGRKWQRSAWRCWSMSSWGTEQRLVAREAGNQPVR
jgi:hypothetical protein